MKKGTKPAKERTFDDFDGFAKDYRDIHNECLKFSGADSDFFSEQKVAILKRHEQADDLRILDLGCGDGNSARFFRKHFPKASYDGVDTSQRSIEIARQRKIDRSEFGHYDGQNIPAANESFDIVFVACVFHHIDRALHANVLAEIRRVLRDGGRLYLFEHNPLNPLTKRVVKNCPFDEDAVLLSARNAREMVGNALFRDIGLSYTIFFPGHKLFNGLRRLERHLEWLPIGGQYYVRAIKGGS
ncbi:MAG: class I SAM-dependent methyltransferase [Chloracidobacterium sp.]|nr:class I SAM-dependent methyltransferase [Chloracidobacterium sp.]